MQTYGRSVEYPVLSAYTTTAGTTAGPRIVRLWRVVGNDNYLRLANADHECWPVSTDTGVDNGLSEPERFGMQAVNTAPEDFPKSWQFLQGGYYYTKYDVSWWNKDWSSSTRKAFLRFRPVVVAEYSSDFAPAGPPSAFAQTHGFGLVQYFGQKSLGGNIYEPPYGVGIVMMASIPDSPSHPQTSVSFRKYLVFFVGDRCVWHYEFPAVADVAHATKQNNIWVPFPAHWITMRPSSSGNAQSNEPINIGVFTYSADDNVSEQHVTGLPGALASNGAVDIPNTKIDRYTQHRVVRVQVLLSGENQTPSGGATQADRTGTGTRQWHVPSITEEPFTGDPVTPWIGWNNWWFHTWLLGVQSAFREFTCSIPLNFPNPPSSPYRVRARSLHQPDLPLNATAYFVRFRGTDNAAHFPNSPSSATSYTPVSAPYPYNCCGWYRPWDTTTNTEPSHRYWWVDHKIVHGAI